MPALLDARSLVKHLGGRRVVDGVDLACETSQIVGLLGPNGAGKTTTLRMLYGFLRPDAGQIHVNGVELGRDLVRAKRAIGVCTQDEPLTVTSRWSRTSPSRRATSARGRPISPGAWPSSWSASTWRPTRGRSRRRSRAATGAG